jgi:periplasmic protein TonB
MNFSKYINTQFNFFHAVTWSIGLHIIIICLPPSLKNEVPIKSEKPNEKIRIKISNKAETETLKQIPVAMSPVSAMPRKHFVEPKVSLIPIKVDLNNPINPSIMKTLPKFSKSIKNINPVSSHIQSLVQEPVRIAHISNSLTIPLIRDVKVHKNQIKNIPTLDKKFLNANINQNKSNFTKTIFYPKPRAKVTENKLSYSEGITRKTSNKSYYKKIFNPELRKIEKGRVAKKEMNIDFEKLWSEYSYLIRMRVASAKTYPESAREKNQQGKATLSLKLGKDGSILNVSIGNSSGHKILDQAAIDAIKDAAPYPKIPDKLDKQYVLLKLPISFILN